MEILNQLDLWDAGILLAALFAANAARAHFKAASEWHLVGDRAEARTANRRGVVSFVAAILIVILWGLLFSLKVQ